MNGQPEVDLAHIHWFAPEWIYALPTHTLSTPDEALDYFALSPFWDQQSNNNSLRIQNKVHNANYGAAEEKFLLHDFKHGFEYVIGHSQPPDLFVVHKRIVNPDGSRDNVAQQWFILEGKIYPTPTLYDVLSTKIRNASFLISSTFTDLANAHPPSNPRSHSAWRAVLPSQIQSEAQSGAKLTSTTPAPPDASPTEEKTEKAATTTTATTLPTTATPSAAGPNWPLLNALSSTQASLAGLNALSTAPPRIVDGREELRRLEENINGPRPGSTRSVSVAPTVPKPTTTGDGRTPMGVGTPAIRFGATSGSGTVGRTPAVTGMSPVGTQ